MKAPVSDLRELLSSLEPVLNEGTYVFVSLPAKTDHAALDTAATIREREGLTVVVKEEVAQRNGWHVLFQAAWITLEVHSDLHAVGLTAAFSGALTEAQISCNVIAGACHDHLFVPVERAEEAVAILRKFSLGAQARAR